MNLKGRINFFIIFISIILLGNFKNVNASLQDQYRAQKCTFNNAPFQDSESDDQRYCINNVNKRVTLVWEHMKNTLVYEGFVGKPELVFEYGNWTIYEWVLDSNKLTLYSCFGNSRGCTGEVSREIVAIKR